MKCLPLLTAIGAAVLLSACTPLTDQSRNVAAAADAQDRVTLGTVQREIHVGMTNSQVASTLGAPNVVTTDDKRRETWVYDKIATQNVYSASAGGVNALFLAGASSSSGISQTTQRTLTVIIKYDETGRVRDFSYRASSF